MKVHPRIQAFLDATGHPWRLENGGRHIKIRVRDHLVGVWHQGGRETTRRITLNTIRTIKNNLRAKGLA